MQTRPSACQVNAFAKVRVRVSMGGTDIASA